jgi:hypothetical protein
MARTLSAARSRIASVVRSLKKLEEESERLKEEESERLEESSELLLRAYEGIARALASMDEARKLAEETDRRARIGPGSRVVLNRRLRSRELLAAVSSIRGGLARLAHRTRTAAGLQEEAVGNPADIGFE